MTTCALNVSRAVTIRRRVDAVHTPVSTNVSAPPATTAAACVTSASVRTRASYSAVPTPADTFYAPLPRGGGAFWNSAIRPSVCLSVCPMYRPLQQRAAGLLLWARSGRRYRSIAARPALSRNCVTLSAEHRLVIRGNSVPHFRAYLFSNCPQGSSQGS